jgi:hypothetical protein
MNRCSLMPKKHILRCSPKVLLCPLSAVASHSQPYIPFALPAKSLHLYLLGLSVTVCATLMFSEKKAASCAAEEGVEDKIEDKNALLRSFFKELHVLLREDQINVDSDDCQDRGKPWNSYHKIDIFPQVGEGAHSSHGHLDILTSCISCDFNLILTNTYQHALACLLIRF